MAQIITIAGRAGAGKDTFAELLADALAHRGLLVNMDRFAAPLKAAAKRIFGPDFDDREVKERSRSVSYGTVMQASRDLLSLLRLFDERSDRLLRDTLEPYSDSAWSFNLSPREYQQKLGTEVVRMLDQDAWVSRVLRDARRADADYVIVPDCRFGNEVKGLPILVYRPGVPALQHVSERMANLLYASLDASLHRAPETTIGAFRVVWNVADEHLLQLQADILSSKLALSKRLSKV